MTTSSVAKAPTAAAAEPASVNAAEAVQVPGVSRREFLYYAWTASLALLTAQAGGIIVWFMLPRFREGEFGGVFVLAPSALPTEVGSTPADFPEGKFWLSNSDEGVLALYKVCTHLGCLYKWVDANNRFECPCHGSKFQGSGVYIEGPAPRSLDRFALEITTTTGEVLTSNVNGDPIQVNPANISQIKVDTGARIKRPGRV